MKSSLTVILISLTIIVYLITPAVLNGKELKMPEDEDVDSSGFSSDGPVIVYQDSKVLNYSVIPNLNKTDGNLFEISVGEISKDDTLTCIVDETVNQFDFKLKENIQIEKDTYELPEKMLIISDIEGSFRGFQMILEGAGVINENFEWTFGIGHLVLNGDFFDRGINVNECLWLIYKLESEAEMHGGKVHFILGNHEIMVLQNDLRYVRQKYFDNADSLGLDYSKWYSPETELGRWLRSKNAIENIGGYLFVHAGLSKDVPYGKYTLTQINDSIRYSIDIDFEREERRKNLFIGSKSPIWYRGIMEEEETQAEVDSTLEIFNANKMVLGHTVVDSIKYLYNKKVIGIDLHHQENSDKGFMYALFFENGEFYVINNSGNKSLLK